MGGGWFVLDNANAMKIWPRNPGGRRRGGALQEGDYCTIRIFGRNTAFGRFPF